MSCNVVAIVWTYRRAEEATRCVVAALGQTRPPERVMLVDSASPNFVGEQIGAKYSEIDVITLRENDGPGACIAAAMRASEDSVDFFWLLEDDSIPGATALESLLRVAGACDEPVGVIGPDGYDIRWGQWRNRPPLAEGASELVDLVMLDGSLVSAEMVRTVGVPRSDYFLMMVDVEYPLRGRRKGFQCVHAGTPYVSLRLGAGADNNDWRAYYQTRNHLRMAYDLRSVTIAAGFGMRTAKQLVHETLHRQWRKSRFRLLGLAHACCGWMGRRIEPT